MKTIRTFIVIILWAAMTYTASANITSPGNKSFIYRVKISTVTDKTSFSDISGLLQDIFSNTARFNDTTDEVIIFSDYDLSSSSLSEKLTEKGYTLSSYRQAIIPAHDF